MTLHLLAHIALWLAGIASAFFLINLIFYRRLRPAVEGRGESFSVLIPARNEERNLPATLESVLANRDVGFEVVVLDDHSTDRTAEIVKGFAARDARVRLEAAPELPPGWCGKPHACHVLAERARHPLLMFLDADVRLAPDALARIRDYMAASPAALLSGVPRQELGTFLERLLIPLIHFVLLGYLPMFMMRWTRRPSFSAGCGQLFVARAEAYRAAGGHAAIRTTWHDGVKLPRLFRGAGFYTELFDATDVATCRMYRSNAETWSGLGKNATEGLGSPAAILPMTVLLFGGQVLPFVLLAIELCCSGRVSMFVACAVLVAWLPRWIASVKFRQGWLSPCLHPVGVTLLLVIQWLALAKARLGRSSEWKGRVYPAAGRATKPLGLAAGVSVLLLLAAGSLASAGETTNQYCRSFTLRDQFNVAHQVQFPRTNVIVLTVADRDGNAQVDSWIAPLKKQRPTSLEILGIADVQGVPQFFRDGVRKKVVKTRPHAVMLDWEGEVLSSLRPEKARANIFVIDRGGKVRARFVGAMQPELLEQLLAAVDAAGRDSK